MSSLVLLTGASGFIAAHCLDQLLRKGYKVRGTVRSEGKAEKIRQQFPNAGDNLEFAIVEDLVQPGAFNEAIKGVDYVVHVASPFQFNVKDNRELLDPAVKGTKSILEAASTEPKVKKVVITSSFASIGDFGKGANPGHVYTEKDWNPVTWDEALKGDGVIGYFASKTFAEKELWKYKEDKKPHYEVAAVCPTYVFGPVLNAQQLDSLNTSNQVIWTLLKGETKEVQNDIKNFVDVRDVAENHVLAMEAPGSDRYFCTSALFNQQQLINILREQFPEYASNIPKGNPEDAKIPPLEEHYQTDNSNSKKLGVNFRDLETTVRETAASLIDLAKQQGKL